MRRSLFLCFVLIVGLVQLSVISGSSNDDEFDDFAEFDEEEFESPPEAVEEQESKQAPADQPDEFEEDAKVEVEAEDFNDFDEDEFEGAGEEADVVEPKTSKEEEKLVFAKVPVNLRRNWTSYYLELLMIFGMLVYLIAFLLGRSKNSTLAQAWFKANKEVLESNFSIVGDDGSSKEPTNGVLMKESDHSYVMWCSGRIGVEGMLVQLRMVKRQDLVNFMQRIMRPACDQIVIRVTMEKEDMDSYIFCLAQKKSAARLHKDVNDLSLYIEGKKKAEDYGLASSYQVLSEIGEATKNFLSDQKVLAFIQRYEGVLEYMHFSDQFSGDKPADEDSKTVPETTKSLIFCFNLGKKGNTSSKDLPQTLEWTKFVLYCTEKCRKFRLSKEARNKAEKNRQKVASGYNKLAHQQRSELAQQRREEKLKAETEKYMNEEDPIKARKMEEKRQKKEQARKLSKMKAVKIKSA